MKIPTTTQERFDLIVNHAAKKVKCLIVTTIDGEKTEVCQYRNTSGNRCFIGVLIPDELYNEEMESLRVEKLIGQYESLRPYLGDDITFLAWIQKLHDRCKVEQWLSTLKDYAKGFDLKFPEDIEV